MASGRTTITSITTTLTLVVPIGSIVALTASRAEAATPTYYNDLATFQATVTNTVTDDYSNPGYVFLQSNAAMNAVLGQTDYTTTGFLDWNIVSGGVYCAGCNGSFQLSFQTTSMGTAAGVEGVGMNIAYHDPGVPYYAYITFADGTTANIQLPGPGSFWAVSAPERIERIHFGLSMGGTTQAGSFGIDNLIVGDYACMVNDDCVHDTNPCTDRACVGGVCQYPFNAAPCNDGNACTDGDVCAAGTCQGAGVSCDDANPCTTDTCDVDAGCSSVPNADPCDDGNACTDGDVCAAGTCQGAGVSCDDANPCTTDTCDVDVGCANVPNADPCDDANPCTEDDVCAAGACQGVGLSCDDGNPCTTDTCDVDTGCSSVENVDPCDDADPCTEMDVCSAGACGGLVVSCDDANPCTADSCDPMMGCVGEPIEGCCLVDMDCGAEETCDPETHACVPIPASSSDGGTSSGGDTGDTSDTGSTSTPADTGVDDTGGSGSGGQATGSSDTGSVDSGITGSTGTATETGSLEGGATPTSDGSCACTTTPSPRARLWWLMVPLGLVLRRRRRAA